MVVTLALVNQYTLRMRHIVICGLPRSTVSTIYYKQHDIRKKKKLLNIKCVLIFSTILLSNISHSKKNSTKYSHK